MPTRSGFQNILSDKNWQKWIITLQFLFSDAFYMELSDSYSGEIDLNMALKSGNKEANYLLHDIEN